MIILIIFYYFIFSLHSSSLVFGRLYWFSYTHSAYPWSMIWRTVSDRILVILSSSESSLAASWFWTVGPSSSMSNNPRGLSLIMCGTANNKCAKPYSAWNLSSWCSCSIVGAFTSAGNTFVTDSKYTANKSSHRLFCTSWSAFLYKKYDKSNPGEPYLNEWESSWNLLYDVPT